MTGGGAVARKSTLAAAAAAAADVTGTELVVDGGGIQMPMLGGQARGGPAGLRTEGVPLVKAATAGSGQRLCGWWLPA